MARFQKTSLRAISAVCFLLALYAVAGAAYGAFQHSRESVVIWIAVAVVATIAGIAYHLYITRKPRPAP